jgi:hypothetical protein
MKIIILSPVKNEDWILDRFLSVCSQFADHILIADQGSTDHSKIICSQYDKVVVIENNNIEFNEGERQVLLINEARKLFGAGNLLLALDADEILAADALSKIGWQTMLKAKPGTILYFEKPDLSVVPYKCIRWKENPFPIGYIDDGTEHIPTKIHSMRIPNRDDKPRLVIHDVKFLHYAHVRVSSQAAKMRLYSVIENTIGVGQFTRRRFRYSISNHLADTIPKLEDAPTEWFQNWERQGIDMHSIPEQKYYWQDLEVLKYFEKHGFKRYWKENIWSINWEYLRQKAVAEKTILWTRGSILPPPRWMIFLLGIFDKINAWRIRKI